MASFQIRFHAHGVNSSSINDWIIDNIKIIAAAQLNSHNPCVTGYQVYVDNTIVGTFNDTTCQILPTQVVYGVSSQVCVKAIFSVGISSLVCSNVVSQYLYPPRNLQATGIENGAYIQWQKPQMSNNSTPPGLLGYRVCRGGMVIHTILIPDTLSCWDVNLDPGKHDYTVNAIYDLAPYGVPNQTGYSVQAGPYSIYLSYCCVLPFFEDWSGGSLAYNNWGFSPNQGNWFYDVYNGNPLPAASFKGLPAVTNYSYALISHYLPTSSYSCANIFLDFDYKLSTVQATSTEYLIVELNRGGDLWDSLDRYPNAGNTDWLHKHIFLKAVSSGDIRIRFRAYGANSTNINSWLVDNITVYANCIPPVLTGSFGNDAVTLTWNPPNCNGNGNTFWQIYDDGGAEAAYGGTLLEDLWVGNKFTGGWSHGMTIHEVQAFFRHLPNQGSDFVTIDLFNSNHIKIVKEDNKYYLKVFMESDSEEDIDLKNINNKELIQLEKYPIVNRYISYRYKN